MTVWQRTVKQFRITTMVQHSMGAVNHPQPGYAINSRFLMAGSLLPLEAELHKFASPLAPELSEFCMEFKEPHLSLQD